jgi:hypothetical protein
LNEQLSDWNRDPATTGIDVPQLLRVVLDIKDPRIIELHALAISDSLACLPYRPFCWDADGNVDLEVSPFDGQQFSTVEKDHGLAVRIALLAEQEVGLVDAVNWAVSGDPIACAGNRRQRPIEI